jgi:hypothetical protein
MIRKSCRLFGRKINESRRDAIPLERIAGWAADGIPLARCLGTIEAYLNAHAAKCQSGASDRLFRWIDIFLRAPASPSRLARADMGTIKRVERVREEDWLGEY